MSSRIIPATLLPLWCLLALLAAVLFGGNGPTAAPALVGAAGFLTITTLSTTPPRQPWPLWPLFAVLGAMAWGLVQTLPIPALANPLWAQAATALGQPLPQSASINPTGTQQALAQGAAYLGTFICAWLLTQRSMAASAMLRVLALSTVAVAGAGLAMYATGNTYVWNLPKTYYLHDLSSPFINRNTMATFMGLGVMLNLAVLLERWGELPGGRRTPWKQRAQAFLNLILMPRWGYLMGAGLCFIALLLTHSRAGLACTVLGLLVMLGSLFIRKRGSAVGLLIVLALLGALFASALSMLGTGTGQRFTNAERDSATRATIYQLTAESLLAAPFTGSGLGTFEEAFRLARNPQLTLTISARVDKAHNTWLQLAQELGLPAFLLLMSAVGWLVALFVRGLSKRKRGITYPALGLGVATLAGTHGLFDFSLQIPGFTYMALLALGLAAAQSSRMKDGDTTPTTPLWPRLALLLPALCAMAVALPAAMANHATTDAQRTLLAHQRRQTVSTTQLEAAHAQLLPHENRFAPELAMLGMTLIERAKQEAPRKVHALRLETRRHAMLALAGGPANPYAWHRLATAQTRLGNPRAAAKAMGMSLLTGPFEPNLAWQRLPLLAELMPYLSTDDRAFALSLIHQLWTHQSRRTWEAVKGKPGLEALLATAIAHDATAVAEWPKRTRKPFPLR